jgi:hypothetical protein
LLLLLKEFGAILEEISTGGVFMTSTLVANTISWAVFALWLALGLMFWKKKITRRFPATGKYIALKIAATPALAFLAHRISAAQGESQAFLLACRSILFWMVYLAGAVLLFYICIEIFRSALAAYPGLMKFGVVIVRWVAVVSVIVSLTPALTAHYSLPMLTDIATGFMRAVSVVEICLLAFLCLGMNALRLSCRSLTFGLAVGFGLMSVSDIVKAACVDSAGNMSAPAQIVRGAILLAALAVWIVYCALPGRELKPEASDAAATVARWNEIASALGHNGARVNVQPQHAEGFFLSDVECVVDKVLNRNLKNNESGS